MKAINQRVDLDPSLEMRMQVSMDGQPILEKECDSLVGNFMRMLHSQAGSNAEGGYVDSTDNRSITNKTIIRRRDQGSWGLDRDNENAVLDSSVVPAKLNLDPNNNNTGIYIRDAVDGLAYIWSKSSNLEGFYCLSQNSGGSDRYGNNIHTVYLWNVSSIDRINGSATAGTELDLTSTDMSAYDGSAVLTTFNNENPGNADRDMFRNSRLVVGKNKDNNATQIESFALQGNWQPALETTGTSVSAPAVDTNESVIEISRTFSNNQSFDIPIGVIGLTVDNSNDNTGNLITRDPVSFTVASGSTVTVTYKIAVSNTSSGGITAQFNEILYMHLATSNREIRDIYNNKPQQEWSPWSWIMAHTGGDSRIGRHRAGLRGRQIGPQVGIGTANVANTNAALDDQIPHGYSDDRMVYNGSVVEDFFIEPANSKAYFDVSRVFENRGSTTIGVNETGVYAGASDHSNDNRVENVHLIARHQLGTTTSVAAGELLKVTYRFVVDLT